MPPRSCLVLALLCACAPDAPDTSDAPDAGTTERALTAALAAGGALGEAVPIDETKVIPYPWSLDIHTTAFHGGRHYVLATDWLAVLDGDGIPVDRRRFAFGPYESTSDADLAVSDDRLAVAFEDDGFLRLHIRALEGGLPGEVIADVEVQPSFLIHWMSPQVLFGGGLLWIVYEHPPADRASETSTIAARRFTLDGVPLGDAPITIATVPRVTWPQATFGGGHLYVGWVPQGGAGGYVARVSPEGRVDRQPRALQTGSTTFVSLEANDRGVLVAIDGAAYRLDHDLLGGMPFRFSTERIGARVHRTSRGFRLTWPDVAHYQAHLRDFPDGAAPDAEVAPANVEYNRFATVDAADRTVLVYEGYGDQLSHALRLGADGTVEARDIALRDTMRSDHDADLVVSGNRRLLRWTRSTRAEETRLQAMLTPDAAIIGAPAPAIPGTLHPRTGGFWQHQGTTVQALDGDLQPVGAAITVAADSRLTPLDTTALVTWQDSAGLHGLRIEAGGPVGAPLLISTTPLHVNAAAASVDTWLLVGCDSTGVRAVRVAASGAVLDTPALTIPASAPCYGDQQAVGHDDGAFTIAWPRELAGTRWEVWTTRLVGGTLSSRRLRAASRYGGPLRLAADGGEALAAILDTTASLYRLRADGTATLVAAYDGDPDLHLLRSGPGHFQLIGTERWRLDDMVERRVVRRELAFDPAGTACTSDAACASGYCADGVCCDRACGEAGACAACSVAAGGAVDGVCGPRAAGAPCRAATSTCDAAETCDGAATVCPPDAPADDATACDDGSACTTGDACQGGACRGAGVTCPAPDECHTATCEPATGCASAPVGDGTPCGGGTCQGGVCIADPVDAGAPDAGAPDAGSPGADARLADAGAPSDARTPLPPGGDDGCGCRAGSDAGAAPLALLIALALVTRRRR